MNPSIQEIVALIKEGYSQDTIVQRLIRRGLDENTIQIAYVQAYAIYLKGARKKVRIINGSIVLILLLIGLFLLPITLTGNYPILTAVVLSIPIFWCGFSFIMGFPDSEHRSKFFATSLDKVHPALVLIIALVPVILLCVSFSVYFNWEVSNEIQKHGVVVDAYITDGNAVTTQSRRRFTTRTSTSYTLKILFTSKSGKEFILDKEVSTDIFNSVYLGMKTKVRYSKKHPEFFDLLYTPAKLTEEERILQMLGH